MRVKTHKLIIFIATPATTSIYALKVPILSALSAEVTLGAQVPVPSSIDDFAVAREVKERGRPVQYEVLEDHQILKDVVVNWDSVFLRFKDANGKSFVVLGPNSNALTNNHTLYSPALSWLLFFIETYSDRISITTGSIDPISG